MDAGDRGGTTQLELAEHPVAERRGLLPECVLRTANAGLAARLGARVLVCQTVAVATELALGIESEPELGRSSRLEPAAPKTASPSW